MVRFLEFLFKVSTPLEYIYAFLDAPKNYSEIFLKFAPYEANQFFHEKENLEQWMHYLLDLKLKNPANAFLTFIYNTQSAEFDRAFISTARLLVASFLLSHDERISMFFDDTFNSQISKILTMGEEA